LDRLSADELLDGLQAALVGRDRSAFAAFCALDVHYEDPFTATPLHGCEALAEHAAKLWVAVPGAQVQSTGERLTDGRFVAAPLRLTGRHTGEIPGVPATRRDLSLHAVLYCELDPPRERLWRVRAFFDVYAMSMALGILPPHGGVGERAMMMLRGFGLRTPRG
jgi:predicted ester cyclase